MSHAKWMETCFFLQYQKMFICTFPSKKKIINQLYREQNINGLSIQQMKPFSNFLETTQHNSIKMVKLCLLLTLKPSSVAKQELIS